MRTLRLIGIALLTVLMSVNLTACGGDDKDEPSGGGNPLVGTWTGKGQDSAGYVYNAKVVFNSDGSGVFDEWKDDDSKIDSDKFKYTYTSNTIVFDWGDGSPETWTYSITGNKMQLIEHGISYSLTKQ